jgi:hypothetical protein
LWFYIMIFIWCVFAFVINNTLKYQKEKRIFEIITLFLLCVISGTRYYLGGTDYSIYESVYNSLPELNVFLRDYHIVDSIYRTLGFERGYLFLNSLIKTLGFNFYGFTLIHSVIFYTLFYLGLKRYTDNFNFIIIVFLYKLFFYNTFISMRQSLTVVIFFYALKYLEEKKSIKYFLCCLIGLSFHNGAIMMFFVYCINKLKLTKRSLVILNIIFIPTIIVGVLNFPVMKMFEFIINFYSNSTSIMKAESLINGELLSSIGLFHTFEYLLIMVLVIINFNKIINISRHSEFIIKLFLILLPILTLFRGYEILTRAKDYFTLTYGIILGYLCLINNGRYQNIIQYGTIIVCAYGFFRFILLFDNGAMIPYESYLFKNVSIFLNN